MAAPAITTLLTPNPASGNITADGTEQTLASGTSSAGMFQLQVDCANMTDTDTVVFRIYKKVNGSATEHLCRVVTWMGSQPIPIKDSDPVGSAGDYKATLQQTAGTNRTYQWCVMNLAGT